MKPIYYECPRCGGNHPLGASCNGRTIVDANMADYLDAMLAESFDEWQGRQAMGAPFADEPGYDYQSSFGPRWA